MKYKFLREVDGKIKSNYGDISWELGKWKKHKGKLEACESGFHCSNRIGEAFSFVQGEFLAEVETRGEMLSEKDKEVWSEMRITKLWKWQKKDSVAISIFAAELCLENFEKVYPDDKRPREAIEAAKKWLENPTKDNESAARSAAWSARSAAWSAARSAARSAAESAAESARSAVYEKIYARFDEQLSKLEPYEQ